MAQALDKLLGENEGAEAPGKETLEDRIERLEGEVGELRDRVEAIEPVGEGGGADDRGSGEGDVEEGGGPASGNRFLGAGIGSGEVFLRTAGGPRDRNRGARR